MTKAEFIAAKLAELIAAKLAEPIKRGDRVEIKIAYEAKESKWTKATKKKPAEMIISMVPKVISDSGTVTGRINSKKYGICYLVEGTNHSIPNEVELKGVEELQEFRDKRNRLYKAEWLSQSTYMVGVNPFAERLRVDFASSDIASILGYAGYGRRADNYDEPHYKIVHSQLPEEQHLNGKSEGGVNFNPFIIDKNGIKQYYQRPLIWSLEQKQLLIQSIFNQIEIGKFVFKRFSWKEIEKQMNETGHGYLYECIDGKQRFHAILEYVQNKFPAPNGVYFDELSAYSKNQFTGYRNLTVGILEDEATYEDIIKTFLTINFTGTPMTKEHIDFVQSIKLK